MQFINHRGEDFLIAHFQGDSLEYHRPAVLTFAVAPLRVSPEIAILTFATRFSPPPNLLIDQLEHAGIDYLNPAKDMGLWENPMKIGLVIEATKQIAAPYTLILDARDVLLAGPLDDIVARFETYGRAVLFGATKSNHPPVTIDRLKERDWLGEFKHLNAGTCFGRTEAVRAFYERAAEIAAEIDNPWRSEQFIVRHVFAEDTETVGFDWRCSIFQTFGRVGVEQVGEVVRIS